MVTDNDLYQPEETEIDRLVEKSTVRQNIYYSFF